MRLDKAGRPGARTILRAPGRGCAKTGIFCRIGRLAALYHYQRQFNEHGLRRGGAGLPASDGIHPSRSFVALPPNVK
jgi:hypothetical protein